VLESQTKMFRDRLCASCPSVGPRRCSCEQPLFLTSRSQPSRNQSQRSRPLGNNFSDVCRSRFSCRVAAAGLCWRSLNNLKSGADPPIDLLRPFESEEMQMSPANQLVGNVRNNGPEMLNSA
jgi:hypothetical protein